MSRPVPTRALVTIAAVASATAMLAACGGSAPADNGSAESGSSTSEGSAEAGAPIVGGELLYLEYQPYTTLYPPQAGFYPNGALVNNIAAAHLAGHHPNPEPSDD